MPSHSDERVWLKVPLPSVITEPPELENVRETAEMPTPSELRMLPDNIRPEEIDEPTSVSDMLTVAVAIPVAERVTTAEPLTSSESV